MYNKYIDIKELEEIKEKIRTNNLDYKSFLLYYKLALVLNDKNFNELLFNTMPINIDNKNEEKFYEIKAKIKCRLLK